MRYLLHVFNHEKSEGNKKGTLGDYPRGWTGRIGTWMDYFSSDNVAAYNDAIDKFESAYPQAEILSGVYKDLRITEQC
jgi:hypothetical protein